MIVRIQKLGKSAALRIPAETLKQAGLKVGQRLDLTVVDGLLYLEPVKECLESLADRISADNCHDSLLDDAASGREVW